MIKKITILLLFTFAITPVIFNKVTAQNYATEETEGVGGSIVHWIRIDYTYGDPDWVINRVDEPGQNDPFWDRDPEDENDPVNDPEWGYPDWADLLDYLDFLNESQGDPYDFQNVTGSPTDSTMLKYFIKVDDKPEKYYDGSRFNFPKRNRGKVKFTIGEESGSFSAAGVRWKINGVVKTNFNNDKTMWLPLETKAAYNVEVWEESTRKYIQFNVSVYGGAAVFFHRKDNYTGEYGFDEVGYRYDSLKKDYQKILVDSLDYNVPWMSLLDGQTAAVKVSTVITPEAASDTSTWVEFRPSASGKIQINGSDRLRKRGNELSSFTSINITGFKLDTITSHYPQDSIVVVNNTGDTVGKVMITCLYPEKRKVILVYVNTGNGFRNYSASSFRDSLNLRSHNQIFRQWEVVNPDTLHLYDNNAIMSSRTVAGMDTINLASEFSSQPAIFMNDSLLNIYIDTFFMKRKNIDIKYEVNNGKYLSNNIHFSFIMNYPLTAVGNSTTIASADRGRYHGIFWSSSEWRTVVHEMGHILGLKHTFRELNKAQTAYIENYGIPIYSTTNFMDYYRSGFDVADMFFYRQWKDAQ
jgi:hypothetical protein